jgi:hypothetical protein
MNKIIIPMMAVAALLLAGCSSQQETPHTRGVYMLLDTSGTYTEELKKAQLIINYTLAKLSPGDTFAVARVDTGSFSEKDIVAKVTFNDRPSMANRQKLKFRDDIDRFIKSVQPSAYTDITGGMLQGIEYLNEAGVGKKTILIFSDLKEELKKGYVRDIPLQVGGFEVVALNVTKLRSDNIDPREYMDRLSMWQSRIESGEGTWRVINDMERLESVIID